VPHSTDTRKVLRDNYYSSAAAASELRRGGRGLQLVTLPAEAAREIASAAAAAGTTGRVQSPPASMFVAVACGLLLCGLLAYDVGGCLDSALRLACDVLGWKGSGGSVGASFLGSSLLQWFASSAETLPALHCTSDPLHENHAVTVLETQLNAAMLLLRPIFLGALLCHGIDAVIAFLLALIYRQAALTWAAQTAILGFASLQLLVRRTAGAKAAAWVPLFSVTLFISCAVLISTIVY
jgi:hypothetical protein